MKQAVGILLISLSLNTVYAQRNDTAQTVLATTIFVPDEEEAALSPSQQYFYGLRMYHENDVLTPIGTNTDDNYTGGIKLEFITNTFKCFQTSKILNPLQWKNLIQNFSFGFTVFTPQDIASNQIVLNDRPYASYLFYGMGASFINDTKLRKAGYELLVGSMGQPLAGEVQRKIHREHWLGSERPVPKGWDYEIANGGALAINLRLFYDKQLANKNDTTNFDFSRFIWKNELNLGQYTTNLSQGLRLNLFNYRYRYEDSDPPIITKRVDPNAILKTGKQKIKNQAFSFTAFVEPRVRLMLHNTALTGKLLGKRSVHTVGDVRPLLLEYEAGVQVRLYFLTVGYTISGRSKEYKLESKDFHNWGGLYASVVHRF